MKRLLLIAVLSAPVAAPVSADDYCAGIGELAYQTMASRQGGVSLSQMIQIANGSEIKDLMTAIAMEAYKEPRYYTQQIAERAAQDFRDRWTLLCLQSTI